MSAPPLPDIFGNYALKNFTEIVPPEAISWLPQTPGWIAVAVILTLITIRQVWRGLRHWWANRYRREALTKFKQLDITLAPQQLTQEANRLLKLAALVAYPRHTVAALSGNNWVVFLNSQCEHPPFDEKLGRWLAAAGYNPRTEEAPESGQLIQACIAWVENHGHVGGQHA